MDFSAFQGEATRPAAQKPRTAMPHLDAIEKPQITSDKTSRHLGRRPAACLLTSRAISGPTLVEAQGHEVRSAPSARTTPRERPSDRPVRYREHGCGRAPYRQRRLSPLPNRPISRRASTAIRGPSRPTARPAHRRGPLPPPSRLRCGRPGAPSSRRGRGS